MTARKTAWVYVADIRVAIERIDEYTADGSKAVPVRRIT